MEERQTLKKSLKPHWVWAIALGSSIGWGAFVQPTNWLAQAGPGGAIIGFSIGALLMMLIAVSYGFLIRSFPVSGGEFAYAFISLGRTHAFICGWFLTLGYICIVALNASAFALMFKFIFPGLIENLLLYSVVGWDVYLIEIVIAAAALGIFGYFNIKGTGLSGHMQFVFCTIMVVSVVVITFMVGLQPGSGLSNAIPAFPAETTALAAIISIVAFAPWAYVGFDNVPQAAEEFNFSSKKAFMLIILAIFFAGLLYSLMILATSMISPWQELVTQEAIWGTGAAIQDLLGVTGLAILVIALTMGIFTGLNGFIISSSRLLFAMSRAKIIPDVFSKLHSEHQTPYVGIIFTVVVAAIAPWFGRSVLLWVVAMSSIGVTIAYFYTCYTAFSLFRWSRDAGFNQERHTVAPWKKATAAIGMLSSLIFLSLLLIPGSPAFLGIESRIALIAWVVLGFVFYMMRRNEFKNISDEDMNYLILGSKNIEIKDRA